MRLVLWGQAIAVSLLAIVATAAVNFAVAIFVPVPSTLFDVLVTVVDLVVAIPFVVWYLKKKEVQADIKSGFAFGVLFLGVQFVIGLIFGLVDTWLRLAPPEFSAHPLIMFISIIVLTLITMSGTGAYLSIYTSQHATS